MDQRFPKSEKLVSHKLIDLLFEKGGDSRSVSAFPLRLVYMTVTTEQQPRQLLISVPKRCFKHAVDRNRVKRQIREAYRKHRDLFTVPDDRQLLLAFIWLDSRHHTSAEVERKVMNLLSRIQPC